MVLCDAVHRDPGTGKWTLLGTFTTFAANEFPATVNFFIYYAVTDGMGDVAFKLRIASADDLSSAGEEGTVYERGPVKCHFENPLVVIEGAIQVPLSLNPGLYHCELYANETLLMSRRLLALKVEGAEKDPGSNS